MDEYFDSEDEFTKQREQIHFDSEKEDEDDFEQILDLDLSEDEEMLQQFKMHNKTNYQENEEEEAEEESNNWGKRGDYYQDESEEDEEQEELEALKIQKRQLQELDHSDFIEELKPKKNIPLNEQIIQNIETLTEKERKKLFKRKLPLVREFLKEFKKYSKVEVENVKLENIKNIYLMNISYYFALITSSLNMVDKNHPVLEKLHYLKDMLNTLNSYYVDEQSELEEAVEDQDVTFEEEEEIIDYEESSEESLERSNEDAKVKFPFEEYVPLKGPTRLQKLKSDNFGENINLNDGDLEEKRAHKKSLRFHANRAQNSVLKHEIINAASADGIKLIDVKTKEVEEKPESELIDFYQENDVNSDELQDVEELDPDQDYYNAVKEDAINRKLARKKERAELYNQLNEPMDVVQEESLDPEEKRKATYKILANRGLTPYRKKENRNPRVKKRIKYDGALKKLKSVRRVAVDKSKIGKYQGETTGIKNNLTRSVRF